MTEHTNCPRCGRPLPAHAPAGLCPKCLIRAGLESELQPQSRPAATIPSPAAARFEPLSVESLAGKFPQLEILELLGKGGMGAVYKARQRGLDRLVAVKVLPPEIGHDPAFAERFAREARALARLSHNHIVSVFDFGQSDGLFYIVMEYVDGVNLRQTIQTGKLTPAEALAIVPQICDALQFAHDEGIVHRDIKPENILIDKRGRVKIADFGLAKLMASGGRESPDISLTATQQVMGTMRYMAPEQMQGSRAVDHRADIYSLGVIFYELLTGELPMGKFAPPSKRVQIDIRLDEIVLRALEQQPEQRYQHASEVKTDVEAVVSGKPIAPSAVNRASGPPLVDHSKGAETEPRLVQAPADCLLLAAGIAFVTACGVALWLLAVPVPTSNQYTNSVVRGNLIGMSVALATYSLMIGGAGLMLRRLQGRLVVLLVIVIVGLFFPAVVALNVLMELRNIPVWPAVIPLWLGMPAALWVVVTLFRDDVRRAFAAASKGQVSNHQQQNSSTAFEPRFSRFAIAGAVWALFGLLAVIPTLFFIALNRVWNGTALATDVIHEQPPLAFIIFMEALLAIGAGAPIGTTISGAIAIGHIKRSSGKIIGLPLALADALFFPLLLLAAAAGLAGTFLVLVMIPLGIDGYVLSKEDPPYLAILLVAASLWFFPARALWRAVVGPHNAFVLPRIPLLSSEPLVGQAALVIALVASAAHAWPWQWIISPNNHSVAISNLDDIGAMQSLLALVLAIAAALFAAAPGLTLPVKRIVRVAAILGAVTALVLQVQFFRSLGEFEPGGVVVRLTRSYPQIGLYATIALTALAILFFVLRLVEETTGTEPANRGRGLVAGLPETRIRFTVSELSDVARQAKFHFSTLGYHLLEEGPDVLVFERGNKWAGLWAFDIRKLHTILTVRTAPAAGGGLWVSCNWSLCKLGSWVLPGNIAILEAEGRGLEALLTPKKEAALVEETTGTEPANRSRGLVAGLSESPRIEAKPNSGLFSLFSKAWDEWWADRAKWFTLSVQTVLFLVHMICLIGFISMTSSGNWDEQGQRRFTFQLGMPSPWFRFETWPDSSTAFRNGFYPWSSSVLFAIAGLAVGYVLCRIEKAKNPKAGFWTSPMAMLTIWILFALVGVGTGTMMGFTVGSQRRSAAAEPAAVPPLGTITSGIGVIFTVPAGQVAMFEIVTRRDNATVPIPNHSAYVMAADNPLKATFLWSHAPHAVLVDGRRSWRIETQYTGGGGGSTEGFLLPEGLDAVVGSKSLGLGTLEPKTEIVSWCGNVDANKLPASGLIGLRITVVPHGLNKSGSGEGHIDWKSEPPTSTTRRKLP